MIDFSSVSTGQLDIRIKRLLFIKKISLLRGEDEIVLLQMIDCVTTDAIASEAEYAAIQAQADALIDLPRDLTPAEAIELDRLGNLIAEYERRTMPGLFVDTHITTDSY